MIKITFPDGAIKEFEKNVTGIDVAQSISSGLARQVLAVSVNGELIDATLPITEDANIKLFTWKDKEGKHAFWHTSAHILAEALEALYPGIKLGIGPAIESGFYYDVDMPEDKTLTDKDFKKIENKFLEISRGKHDLVRKEIPKQEALEHYKNDEYKSELISELEDGTITFYSQN